MEYVKAKKYIIKPEFKKDICNSVRENFDCQASTRLIRYILNDKPLTFTRWLYYFEYELLENILEEAKEENNLGI